MEYKISKAFCLEELKEGLHSSGDIEYGAFHHSRLEGLFHKW